MTGDLVDNFAYETHCVDISARCGENQCRNRTRNKKEETYSFDLLWSVS